MRICSLLPSATEIAFSLNLGDHVFGVSHECDYPPEAKAKRIVVRSRMHPETMSSTAVDEWLNATRNSTESLRD